MARLPITTGLALGAAMLAFPALAGTPACVDPTASQSLVGTRWVGAFTWDGDPAVNQTMTLRSDCVLEYSYKGSHFTNGTWLQRGDMIEWETNDHFSSTTGIVTGRTMEGVMYNRRGEKGTWRYRRTD